VEDIVATGAEQPLRQLVKCRALLVIEGRNQSVGDGARRSAVVRTRVSGRDINAQHPKCFGPAKEFGAVDPAPTVLRGVVAPVHPAPERRPICPLDKYLHAQRGQLGGHGPVHIDDRFQVGLGRTERVERIAIRVVSDQDGIDVGGDVPRQCRSLADDVVLPIGEPWHDGRPEIRGAYGAVGVRTQHPRGICHAAPTPHSAVHRRAQ
jgi:hypothetical protein